MDYNVIVTVDSTANDEATTGQLLDALTGWSPAIGWADDGRMVITVTVNEIGLTSATQFALEEISEAVRTTLGLVGALVNVEALPTAEFDARNERPLVGQYGPTADYGEG